MPTGVMVWFDPKSGEGLINDGREYAVSAADVEPAARVSGARVRFDRVRDRGADRAVRVRLRRGSRVSPRQRRFGDLAGAHHADERFVPGPSRRGQPPPSAHVDRHAGSVLHAWVSAVRQGDVQAAAALNAPDCRIVDGGVESAGVGAARRWLDVSPLAGSTDLGVRVTPEESGGVVEWPGGRDAPAARVVLRVAHGRVVEQRVETWPG
jgi:cold shock CspA family protein